MKASYKWIKALLPGLKASPAAIAERLTGVGIEVEGVHAQAAALANVVAAEVKALEPHPDASALKVAEVFDGEVTLGVVCGAPNVAVGQKVVLAREGALLPNGMKIERRSLRGVESLGMLCSEAELGLSDASEGLLILKPRTRPGRPIAEVLELDDVILEVSPTPNRADVLSHHGLALELAALFGLPPPKVAARVRESKAPARRRAKVEIRDAERCPKYGARIIQGVAVGPSPDWVAKRLKALGLRPISNVVDATNLALQELGQPLHAFDLARLAGPRIVVRLAEPGERLTTLDGQDRALDPDDLVIADRDVPVALAGVMGGQASEVSTDTSDVLLECALFDPRTVRRTARRHGLHTDASHRFERGVDPLRLEAALDRCAALIVELAGGKVAQGRIVAGKWSRPTPVVPIRPERAAAVLGRPVDKVEVKATLTALGFKKAQPPRSKRDTGAGSARVKAAGKKVPAFLKPDLTSALFFEVPSWRVDIAREEDLIEEVARVAGFDEIPTLMPPAPQLNLAAASAAAPAASPAALERAVKDHLASAGFLEAISLAFNARAQAEALGLDVREAVEVENPLGEESALMRMSLLPALLRAVRLNQDVLPSITDLRLFEVGRTFAWSSAADLDPEPRGRGHLPAETLRATMVLRGHRVPASWATKDAKGIVPALDAFDLKAAVESLLVELRVLRAPGAGRGRGPGGGAIAWVPAEVSWLHPRSATRIELDGVPLGVLGELHPDVLPRFGLDGPPVFVADLSLDALAAAAGRCDPVYRPLPKQPPARRDLSFYIGRDVPAARVLEVIERAGGGAHLESVELFDVYEGQGLPEGKRSLAVAMTFRAEDRTLTDTEVEAAQGGVVTALTEAFGAQIRAA